MNGNFQTSEHLIIIGFSYHILRDKLIFQSIINQILCRNSPIQQAFDFINHPLLQSLFQSSGNLLPSSITVYTDTNDERINSRKFTFGHRMFQIISLYLDGTDSTLCSIHICAIVHVRASFSLQILQHHSQFVQAFIS